MKSGEIRERFLKFFQARGHTLHPSDSLVPANDPSLLFTGAGMNQFKDMFLGRGTLPFKRAVTIQKCLRTGDLDNVGRTAAHHTFFEMLGHFSFGDYFKAEAIPWTWEFYHRELGIPSERLFVSVYEKDDEAFEIWTRKVGIPAAKITRFGESDNFWPANAPSQGPNGPCGPCSEIFYDFGEQRGCGKPSCGLSCSCRRYVEIGNIVFTQFDRKEGGRLDPLPQKNIDFGGGYERVCAVVQGVYSNFETDLFAPILAAERDILRQPADPAPEALRRLKRIADHARALVFCIADNALPSNDGRGYVVRRILRTAFRDGLRLGADAAFLHRLVPTVVSLMKSAYPYLTERQRTIEGIIKSEEEAFLQTVHRGTAILEETIAVLKKSGASQLPSNTAFQLYDTFGFPIEMTEDVAHEQGFGVDRAGFDRIMREKSTTSTAGTTDDIFGSGAFGDLKREKEPRTTFLGYSIPMADMGKPVEATVRQIFVLPKEALERYRASKHDLAAVSQLLNAARREKEAPAGTEVGLLCDRTPFYGESGGQIGDSGVFDFDGGSVTIDDTKRPDDYFFHLGRVTKGTLRTGTKVQARIDAPRRRNIMRNHTGTHLLQAALRAVLGTHVEQAGSVVEPDRLRFDFTHFQALTHEEIRKIEDWCNRVILDDLSVDKREMSMSEAKQRGAIAFFGEKYGTQVRVVSVGERESVELCGGTHLEHTATIGQLKIVSESGIQRGVRRIEAVTGPKAIDHARQQYDRIDQLAEKLGVPRPDIEKRIEKYRNQQVKAEVRQQAAKEVFSSESPDKLFLTARIDEPIDSLRKRLDVLMKSGEREAIALATGSGEKPAVVIAVRKDVITRGLKAGDIAKELANRFGAGGGGRDHMAQAGVPDASQIPAVLEAFVELARKALNR